MSDVQNLETTQKIQEFFDRPACRAGIKPLKEKIEIAIILNEGDPAVTLTKIGGKVEILPTPPKKPDLTFWIGAAGVDKLLSSSTKDVGEVGIAILQLMATSAPDEKIKAKVHIGLFDMLRKGYLGVLPLGGPSVMKFLASKGFGSIGKVKDAINHMKGN
jgi:hypothetical protein